MFRNVMTLLQHKGGNCEKLSILSGVIICASDSTTACIEIDGTVASNLAETVTRVKIGRCRTLSVRLPQTMLCRKMGRCDLVFQVCVMHNVVLGNVGRTARRNT